MGIKKKSLTLILNIWLLEITPPGESPIIVNKIFTTEDKTPIITSKVITANKINFQADMGGTPLPDGTTYIWSLNGKIFTSKGPSVDLTFPDFNTDYTVDLKVVRPGGVAPITASYNICTGLGTPTIKSSIDGGTGTDYTFTADTTNTWSYELFLKTIEIQ